MDCVIREDLEKYMQELKGWLRDTADDGLEEMSDFFSARIGGYEEHMSVWEEAYRRFAQLVPAGCGEILDLGCGTGLELDQIFLQNPDIRVTGVDLCREMLDKLADKHRDKNLTVICQDYFQYEMGSGRWEAVLSFESLHHFWPEKKAVLYRKIFDALKEGGVFLLGDYIACCEEEERLLCDACMNKRSRFGVPEDRFIHFDIPLTLEHEVLLLREAGFTEISVPDSINGATMICAEKRRQGD